MNNMSTYSWNSKSAIRKAKADVSISGGIGILSVSKVVSGPHDPEKDAYRSCENCGKHVNYHTGPDLNCPK